jgi:hypothetical protein
MADHVVDSREEGFEERRVVGFVVTQDQVDRRRLAGKRAGDDRPGQEVSSKAGNNATPRDFDAPDYLDRRRAISACAWSRALRTA